VLADRTYPFLMGVSPGSRWPGHDYMIFTWVVCQGVTGE